MSGCECEEFSVHVQHGVIYDEDGERRVWLADTTRWEIDTEVLVRGSGDSPSDALISLAQHLAGYASSEETASGHAASLTSDAQPTGPGSSGPNQPGAGHDSAPGNAGHD